jgi:glyceraldehyde-3-phosphate dehydrogenase/erythrose-4-phosphate dehydrogenase
MTPKTQQPLHPYSVKIETPTGKSATLPVTLLTPTQAEEIQVEFKRLAHEAGIKGARINVQRVVADDYEKVIREAKACLRTAMAKAA